MTALLNKEELEKLYWKDGKSIRRIANMFGTCHSVILRLMRQHDIPRRGRIEAVVKGKKKYDNPCFSGNLKEKAYLLGLTFADLRRRMHGYQIDIATSTTHPEFVNLFRMVFEKYGRIRERPYFNRSTEMYGWRVETLLHPSFEFLLLPKVVPRWITADQKIFLHFLAGYCDGEGTISISKNSEKCVSFIFAIASGDKRILTAIFRNLKKMGYRPSFRRVRRAGDGNNFNGRNTHYKKDRWAVRLKRRAEVLNLLALLPIKHVEKVEKREVMFKLKDASYIKDTMPTWKKLKNKIKLGVNNYTSDAAQNLRSFSSLNNSAALE